MRRLTIVTCLGVLGHAVLGHAVLSLTVGAAPPPKWHWSLPADVAPPRVPADNPMTAAKVTLGRRLFYDADLSIDGTMSCATCHSQRHGFAEDNRTHPGVHGDPGRRNVPGLANVAWMVPLTWADSRLTTLEAQVPVPVMGDHPVEMGMKGGEAEIARRLGRDPCYVSMFHAAFPEHRGKIDMVTVSKAIAAFERTLVAFDTPYDRARHGRATTMSPAAMRGAELFSGRAGCTSCHSGPQFTDGQFHAIGAAGHGADLGPPDRGLGEVTGLVSDDYRFRTPGLRNVALTAPYMHDGETANLAEAIRAHSAVAATKTLSEADIANLEAFLDTLTDRHFARDPKLALPQTVCGRRL
ncbi:di-heme cytochrome c peroxidase [Novosphingobium sp. Rr 2-17]|uniref:cytochrome-c peroxidase n=1 Tax=Novosphingobium sp. Rr 2-17 TaxID=555793 RepID=UPI0002698C0A|nr:cytochrome c peroxidase [Novosphingobium sp. Rr 2-17]EIZ77600.1 di-heme cytochrome c peroxidase [Novosphingobium sp. Rr 2-17]